MGFFSKIIEAREKKAELIVHAHLATYDDATLSRLGVKRNELKKGGSLGLFL